MPNINMDLVVIFEPERKLRKQVVKNVDEVANESMSLQATEVMFVIVYTRNTS